MHRRSVLSAISVSALSLCGCGTRPPPPPKQIPDIKSLGMLPVKEWENSKGIAPFSMARLTAPRPASTVPPISPGLLGMAIGNAIRSAQETAHFNLARALSDLEFDPRASLVEPMLQLIKQRSLSIADIDDMGVAASIWNDTFKTLPQTHDSILDVQMHDAGYYEVRKVGYVPYVSVSARLLDTKKPREVFEEFGYEIGYGDAGEDRRFFSSPPGLIISDLSRFKRDAPAIRQQLNGLYQAIATQLVSDVERVLLKQARID